MGVPPPGINVSKTCKTEEKSVIVKPNELFNEPMKIATNKRNQISYPLESNLSSEEHYLLFQQLGIVAG